MTTANATPGPKGRWKATDWSHPGQTPQWSVVLNAGSERFIWTGYADTSTQAIGHAKADARVARTVLSGGDGAARAFSASDWSKSEPENATLATIEVGDEMRTACDKRRGSALRTLPLRDAKAILADVLLLAAHEAGVPEKGEVVIQAGRWDDDLENKREHLADIQLSADFDDVLTLPNPLRAALVAVTLTCGDVKRGALRAKIGKPEAATMRAAQALEMAEGTPAAAKRVADFLKGMGLKAQAREILSRFGGKPPSRGRASPKSAA